MRRAAGHVVRDDPEVVDRNMGELRAAGAFADRPYARRGRLQALVDADETARVEFDAGLVEADVGGVGNPADRHDEVAAFDLPLSRRPSGRSPPPCRRKRR